MYNCTRTCRPILAAGRRKGSAGWELTALDKCSWHLHMYEFISYFASYSTPTVNCPRGCLLASGGSGPVLLILALMFATFAPSNQLN